MRDSDGSYEVTERNIQICGVLLKKPFGHQSNKWSKRFFLVRDGFLLYYPENERKEFEKKTFFNIHPRGCISLGGCVISGKSEPGHAFCIHISSKELPGTVIIATESAYERDKWISILNRSTKVTLKNVEYGDTIIRQLEHQGLKMAEEKQNYFDQLQNEVMALHDEKLKTEELEKVKDELAKEKEKIERMAEEMKEEYERIRIEMEETACIMKSVESEKEKLSEKTVDLQKNLEELELEKNKTLHDLEERLHETKRLSVERTQLSETTDELRSTLKQIEDKTTRLLNEKAMAEDRLKEKVEEAEQLEDERNAIRDHADELQESIQELAAQKALTEAELKDEIVARLETERRLKEAEESLSRLSKAVQEQSQNVDDPVREEMTQDVKTLKRFFEKLAFEAKLDKDKPIIMRNAVHARKSYVRRAKTLKYEEQKKRRTAGFLSMSTTLMLPGAAAKGISKPFSSLDDLTVDTSASHMDSTLTNNHSATLNAISFLDNL